MIFADPDKVGKARRGDSSAFLELIQERKDDIYRLAFTYMKNREEALAVLHDVVNRLSHFQLRQANIANRFMKILGFLKYMAS